MSDHQQRRRNNIIRIFFLFYPIKIFHSTKLMLVLAAMFALRIVLQMISIPIPGFVLNFSFGYIPVMLIGWYFGPVFGLVCGCITDTLTFFIFPGNLWFWMYAIQEPILGLISGLFASWCVYRRNNPKNSLWTDITIQQIIYIAFAACCYTILILWLPKNETYMTPIYLAYRWIAISLISGFFVMIECFTFYNIIVNRQNKIRNVTFIYTLVLVAISTLVLSFMLGPISAVAYLKYLNGSTPSAWIKYGAVYYLIPRIIVQSIKTPLEALLMTSLILTIDPLVNRMLTNINNRWK